MGLRCRVPSVQGQRCWLCAGTTVLALFLTPSLLASLAPCLDAPGTMWNTCECGGVRVHVGGVTSLRRRHREREGGRFGRRPWRPHGIGPLPALCSLHTHGLRRARLQCASGPAPSMPPRSGCRSGSRPSRRPSPGCIRPLTCWPKSGGAPTPLTDHIMIDGDHHPIGPALIRWGWRIAARSRRCSRWCTSSRRSARQPPTVKQEERQLHTSLKLADDAGATVVRLRGQGVDELVASAR